MDTPFGKIDTSFLTGGGETSLTDAFTAFGGSVLQAGQNSLQQVAATYAKAWNPTTQSFQEVSGNTPTGGRPPDGQITTLPSNGFMDNIARWIEDHPVWSVVIGLSGLGALYAIGRALFK